MMAQSKNRTDHVRGGAMRRIIKASLIFIILLSVFTVSLPTNYLPYIPVLINQVYAASPESWALKNGALQPTKNGLATYIGPAPFHDMVINIANGIVSSNFTIPVNYTSPKGGSFIGSVKFTLQGTYSGSAGMSGQYTWYIDGTLSGDGENQPFKLALTGPFSGPGGLADGKIVSVSFAEAVGPPIPGCEEGGNTKLDPFEVSYTVTKPVVPALPNPASIIKPAACKFPFLKR
jgi:hypothetical protein